MNASTYLWILLGFLITFGLYSLVTQSVQWRMFVAMLVGYSVGELFRRLRNNERS
jgi:hypothetical protein